MQRSKLSAWINSASGIPAYTLLCVLCCALCHCTQHYDQKEAERYIIESERQWAESVASGDTTAVQRILADDFVGVDPKGRHYDKSGMVSDTRKAPKYFVSNHLNAVKRGSTATQRLREETNPGNKHSGEHGRFVWTDTWIRRNGRWQIVAAEDLIAPESPR